MEKSIKITTICVTIGMIVALTGFRFLSPEENTRIGEYYPEEIRIIIEPNPVETRKSYKLGIQMGYEGKAVYEVYNAENKLVDKDSTTNGKMTFTAREPGKYKVVALLPLFKDPISGEFTVKEAKAKKKKK